MIRIILQVATPTPTVTPTFTVTPTNTITPTITETPQPTSTFPPPTATLTATQQSLVPTAVIPTPTP